MGSDSKDQIGHSRGCRFCLDESSAQAPPFIDAPFNTTASLLPLIKFWEKKAATGDQSVARSLLEEIEKTPELRAPIWEHDLSDHHQELLRRLVGAIFPEATWETDLRAIVGLFETKPIVATPSYLQLVPDAASIPRANVDSELERKLKHLYAYSMILEQLYNMELNVDYPIVRKTIDPSTGFPVYVQVEVDSQFIEVRTTSEKGPTLSEEQKDQIRENPADLELLKALLPPEEFEFFGFISIHALKVTDQQLLAEINKQLIEARSIVCPETILELESKLRSLFGFPDLTLGLIAIQGDEWMRLSGSSEIKNQCIFGDSQHYNLADYQGSAHEEATRETKTILVDDLSKKEPLSTIEQDLLGKRVRNLAVAPLISGDQVIGILELASPNLGVMNPMNTMKTRELLPLFTSAIQRSLSDFQTKIDGIIKRQCTVIHPSVEWRFREAAANYLRTHSPESFGQEAIAFKDVFPMYGASDIRNSSRIRNRSISDDLAHELQSVSKILNGVSTPISIPILAQAKATCQQFLGLTAKEIRASDEYRITDFLQTEIRELLQLLAAREPSLRPEIDQHFSQLDPQHDTYFKTRKDYMDSVAQLNAAFGQILEESQEEAQRIYPHYFEKHSTDGVDFTLYIGKSLCRDRDFHPLYLDNLRLWQLILMCDLACTNHDLKKRLPIPLETTHLIAVQDHPVSIRFRFDERLFDVDGAYNARYEIMKKRIDKAMIKGRSERLTQPDKIAIVYSNSKEAAKYRKHIEYLQNAGYLIPGFEDLQVEDLQGVEGLRAMRVTVNLKRAPGESPVSPSQSGPLEKSTVW